MWPLFLSVSNLKQLTQGQPLALSQEVKTGTTVSQSTLVHPLGSCSLIETIFCDYCRVLFLSLAKGSGHVYVWLFTLARAHSNLFSHIVRFGF